MEDVFNQGRMIDDLDKDEGIELVKDADIAETEGRYAVEQAEKQAEIYHLDLDHPSKVLNVVTAALQVSAASATISAAKLSIPAAAPTVVAAYTRRRKGVIIRDLEKELSLKTPAETPKLKDKGKGILIETPKPMKKKDQIELDAEYARNLHEEINKDHKEINKDIDWDAAIDHVNQKSKNPQYIKPYQGMKKRPQTESEAHKNMMIYLKNTAGYKIDFFKGMTYAEICPIFQARFDANMRFLFKSREEIEEEDQEVLKSINETPAQKAAKRRKLNEEAQEAEDLKKRLEVVDDEDDDIFIEATPLARKNFDREDLENLWGIVKKRFSTSKPTNFSDEYLLITLKTMFEKPDGQDAIWKSQRGVHGLALSNINAARLKLKLFKNIVVADVKNLDPANGLCNGMRLICKHFDPNIINAEIVVGQHTGVRVLLPRIPLAPSEEDMFPFKLKRIQFPVRLSFVMTINKAQGKTIPNVGVYFPESVFSHGHLYVVLSRGISRTTTKYEERECVFDTCQIVNGLGLFVDPRDVKIASLKQRIQKLEFPQLQPNSSAGEAETGPNFWDDEPVDVNPFGGKQHRYVNRLDQPRRNDHVVDCDNRYRDDHIRSLGLKIEIPEFTCKVHPDDFIDRLSTVEQVFDVRDIPGKLKVKLVAIKLRQHASLWF
nr:hypothetical protein [Tanacetum cinerariifolium]